MKQEIFKNIFSDTFEALYPNKCMSCGRLIDYERELCEVCERHFETIDSTKRCLVCGFERKDCRCKVAVYHFESLVAPFYNTGLCKRAFYGYKLGSKEHYSKFFSAHTAACVIREYSDLEFDAVCCVPASKQRMRRFGFDPATELARFIAETLGVPFLENALGKRSMKSGQHKLGRIERFKSIRDMYFAPKRLLYKRVLLIDDISSTGATLDECARQLMISGVEHVNCATALITPKNAEKAKKYTLYVLRKAGIAMKKEIKSRVIDQWRQK